LRVSWESGVDQNRFAILAHSNVPYPTFAFVGDIHHVGLIGIDVEGCFAARVRLNQAAISFIESSLLKTSVENLVRGFVARVARGKGDVDGAFLILGEASIGALATADDKLLHRSERGAIVVGNGHRGVPVSVAPIEDEDVIAHLEGIGIGDIVAKGVLRTPGCDILGIDGNHPVHNGVEMFGIKHDESAVFADENHRIGVIIALQPFVNTLLCHFAGLVVVRGYHDITVGGNPRQVRLFFFPFMVNGPWVGKPTPGAIGGEGVKPGGIGQLSGDGRCNSKQKAD